MLLLRRMLQLVLIACAVTYVLIGVGMTMVQRSLIYPRPAAAFEPRLKGGTLLRPPATPDGVVALYLPPPKGAPTIVHFHGNGEQLSTLTTFAQSLRLAGLGFYSVEYPGYGLAAGSPSEESIYAAAERGLRYLQNELHTPNSTIILHGWSLGTGVAVEMSKRGFGSRMILLSPYTSIADVAHSLLPIHPTSLMVLDKFDSLSKAGTIAQPVLLFHGTEDDVIPARLGVTLARALPNVKSHLIPRAGHDILLREDVMREVIAFAKGE